MAKVNLPSWSSEISQAYEGLQLTSTAATWENILARLARIESRLLEHERRVAATLPPLQPEPDPPDQTQRYTSAQPPYPPYQPPYQPDRYPPHNNPWSLPDVVDVSTNSAPPTPPVPIPESYHRYIQPAAATVWQPPHLRSPYSWADMPPQHIQYSGPAYAASTIAPTTTTQGRSCQKYPVDVQQPLIRPTSPYCSKLTPLAVTTVLIPPPPPLTHGSSTAQLLAVAPPPPSPAFFLPCSPDRIHTLSIIPADAAPSQVDDSQQPSLLHLPRSMKEHRPKTCEVQVQESDGVNIHYKGMLTDGTIFNPTFERGDPIDIKFGSGQVIKRWLLVLGMCLGEKRKLKIPSECNFGEHVFDPGGSLVVASWFSP
ncbi:leucine-rich repeat extensin-like protein 3 [Salvia hispanica]|uniref:leucine-rich repeat extensin-like protein 3 n=1 Tax=Salvia hispanica TaxID=49212 RepID=UPI002008EF79|nr:leucine-rich repeat extensin-like protein 3 [Salvia hispanica]